MLCQTKLIGSPKSVYFYHYLFAVSYSAGTHNCPDCLSNSSLLADYSAHISCGNVEMIHYRAVLGGLVNADFDCRLILDKLLNQLESNAAN